MAILYAYFDESGKKDDHPVVTLLVFVLHNLVFKVLTRHGTNSCAGVD
jgi:hypothetical protein